MLSIYFFLGACMWCLGVGLKEWWKTRKSYWKLGTFTGQQRQIHSSILKTQRDFDGSRLSQRLWEAKSQGIETDIRAIEMEVVRERCEKEEIPFNPSQLF